MARSVELWVSLRFPCGVEDAWKALTRGDLTRASQPWGPIPGIDAIHDEPPSFFDEPGSSRVFENSDGSTVVETIRALDPPHRLDYTITQLTNAFRFLTLGADATFEFEPAGGDRCDVTWHYTWHARSAFAWPLLWLVGKLAFRPYMRRMLAGIARQAPRS